MSDRTNHAEDMLLDFNGWFSRQPAEEQDSLNWHLNSVPEPERAAERDRLAAIEFAHERTGYPRAEIERNWDMVRGGLAERLDGGWLGKLMGGGSWGAAKDDDSAFAAMARKSAAKQR